MRNKQDWRLGVMKTTSVAIIDYGVGNLLSVQRAFEYLGADAIISSSPEVILKTERVVLPGVGAFPNAMKALTKLGLIPVLHEIAAKKKPILGLCLGMQLLLDESEEFQNTKGLGLIPGRVIPVPKITTLGSAQKVPHIGWNSLIPSNTKVSWNGSLLQDFAQKDAVYFLHSFMAKPAKETDQLAHVDYGGHKISAVIVKDNIIGCQFHPEKSGKVGLRILENYLNQ
jgi:glutamine amidotransferase